MGMSALPPPPVFPTRARMKKVTVVTGSADDLVSRTQKWVEWENGCGLMQVPLAVISVTQHTDKIRLTFLP